MQKLVRESYSLVFKLLKFSTNRIIALSPVFLSAILFQSDNKTFSQKKMIDQAKFNKALPDSNDQPGSLYLIDSSDNCSYTKRNNSGAHLSAYSVSFFLPWLLFQDQKIEDADLNTDPNTDKNWVSVLLYLGELIILGYSIRQKPVTKLEMALALVKLALIYCLLKSIWGNL